MDPIVVFSEKAKAIPPLTLFRKSNTGLFSALQQPHSAAQAHAADQSADGDYWQLTRDATPLLSACSQ